MTTTEPTPAAQPLDVIDDAGRVAAVLPPLRREILQLLARPDSATGLSKQLGIPRQKVNYHLRELEKAGFLELVEERPRRGCTERIVRAKAESYLVSPALLGDLARDPGEAQDRFSSAWLVAQAARVVHDVALLRGRARSVGKKLATFSVDLDVAFPSPAKLRAFTEELALAVGQLAAKHGGDPDDPNGRRYRFLVGGHPTITKTDDDAAREAETHRRRLDGSRDDD